MKQTYINGRWVLALPDHRADRPEWPWWEATRLAAMHHFIKPGQLVWDIGAEEGDFPALFALWGARVVLIEPNEKVWPNILAIFKENWLVPQIYGSFVGFASDKVVQGAYEPVKGNSFPGCALDPLVGDHGFLNLFEGGAPETTIDHMVFDLAFDPPHHITIDVEGSELKVLQGAQRTIGQYRPYVWVSEHDIAMKTLYNSQPFFIAELLKALGYERMFLCHDHESHVLYIPKEMCWVL